ncbi:hypothetical protein FSP39_001012 [Pinctada imbricata]|uniref:G-protein coupled receptors family 1 profile domain-containing protein n=1 Tax=Pinctada imbricata TaxID=66713 RepID=A0AA88Y6M9_PINIB|nr:hypothetical protein FSP39_001012 [Pinctada imbricata]
MSSGFVDSFGGSFFQWFQTDVLPYIIGSVCIIVFIATLVLDIILIMTLKKRGMLKYPCNRFVFELAVMDLLAAFFVVIISGVVAFMKSWELGSYVCSTHAVAITWFYLVTFGMLTVLFLERTIKIKKPELYERIFQSSRCVNIMSITVWVVDLGIACIALTDWVKVEYNMFHAACVVKYVDNVYYLILIFMLGVGFSTITCFICYFIIFKHKVDTFDQKKKKKDNNADAPDGNSKAKNPFALAAGGGGGCGVGGGGGKTGAGFGGKLGQGGIGGNKAGPGKTPRNKLALMAAKKKIRKAVTKAKVSKMFSLTDDKADPEFHMAVTYFIVYCLMIVCYVPYFAINFADYDDSGEIWGGYYTITVILVMVSYCMKPIIYLSHNKHYRKGYKETMPEKVIVKAVNVTKSINKMMDKLDKVMFKTPGKKKLDATLTVHWAAKRWLRKVRAKRGGLPLGQVPKNNKANDVPKPNPKKDTPRSGASTASPTKVNVDTMPERQTRQVSNNPGTAVFVAHNAYNNEPGTKPPVLRENSWGEFVDETKPNSNYHNNENVYRDDFHQNPVKPYQNQQNKAPQTDYRRQDSWGDFIDEPEPSRPKEQYPNNSYGGGNIGRRESMSPGSKVMAVGISNQNYTNDQYSNPYTNQKSKMSSINSYQPPSQNNYDPPSYGNNRPVNSYEPPSQNHYDPPPFGDNKRAPPQDDDAGILSLELI